MAYDIVDMARDSDFLYPDCAPNPYPYGLRITLTKQDLIKLGVDEMPECGDEVAFYVCGCVISTEERQDEYGETGCVGVQIKCMSIEEPPAVEKEERADAIKGGFKDVAENMSMKVAAKTLYKNQE
jgi:hypothetical protein